MLHGECIPYWPGTSVWGWPNPRLVQTGRLSGAEDRSWPRWPWPIVTSSGVAVAVCLGQFNIPLLGIMTSTPPLPPPPLPALALPLSHTQRTSMHKRSEVAVLSFALDLDYFPFRNTVSCQLFFYLILLQFRFHRFIRAKQNAFRHLFSFQCFTLTGAIITVGQTLYKYVWIHSDQKRSLNIM